MNEEKIAGIVASVINEVFSQKMTLKKAKRLAVYVEKQAQKMGVNAVIAVSDASGNIILAESMDDAYIASYDIAVNKAFTCASLKMHTKTLKPLAQPGQSLYGIQFTNGGRIVIFGGGVVLKCGDRVIGALGVSGGTEEQDTLLADLGEKYFSEEML